MKRAYLLPLAALTLTFAACNKDDDTPKGGGSGTNETEAPVITRITPAGHDITVAAGDTLVFTVRITDNAGLSQVRTNVHNGFDGHSHKTSSIDTLAHNRVHELNGVKDTTLTFRIPTATTNQPGNYHLLVYALDVNGNSAQFVGYDLTLTNSLFPTASSLALGGSSHLHFHAADTELTRTLSGTVSAGTGKTLADIHVVLRSLGTSDHEHDHKTSHGDEIALLRIHDVDAASYTFSAETLTFDKSALEDGHAYELLIEVEDADGRTQVFEVTELDVHID